GHLRERDQDPVHACVELRDLVPGAVEEFGRLLQGGMSGSSVEVNSAARAPVTDSDGRRTDRIAIRARRRRLLVAGAGAAAAQASSRARPGGPSVRSREVGIALIASGANGVEHLPDKMSPQTNQKARAV
ncbi:MAG: hypothetical protein H0W97_11290, partial [Actinobacteria bacterium]|nr:hypothetical protein [Actinomycetota bacterium]